jgi:hypothetical protein
VNPQAALFVYPGVGHFTTRVSGDFPLNIQRLKLALSIRDRSYNLLLWLSEAIDEGLVPLAAAVHHASAPEAAEFWLRHFELLIPVDLQPAASERREFAAFLSTYLTSSFDLVARPGKRGAGRITSCACDVCARIINAPHLQAKKLAAHDKQRANFLMTESLLALALEHGISLHAQQAEQMVQDPLSRRACGYLSYGDWLIRRLKGESDGPAVLALWRLIAWDPRGGQIRGFKLRIADFMQAERQLLMSLMDSDSG